jgi:hypothetical protein
VGSSPTRPTNKSAKYIPLGVLQTQHGLKGEILNEVWGPLDRSEVLKPRAGLGVTADRADVAAAAAPFESAVRLKVMAVSPVSVML